MAIAILDCYTDEPSGLGVPPYLGVYPRYIYGHLKENSDSEIYYFTIDDFRLYYKYKGEIKRKNKTDTTIYNLSSNYKNIKEIMNKTKELIIILGIHTPGKYLSAMPGTLNEVLRITKHLQIPKILTGPAFYGTSKDGGRYSERADLSEFDYIKDYKFSFTQIKKYSVLGAEIIKDIPWIKMIEIETARGCPRRVGCSFCTEPIKNRFENRPQDDIINEIQSFYDLGERHFRLGKQSCFYSIHNPDQLLKKIDEKFNLKTLHIDNVDPLMVTSTRGERITQAIVDYTTPGNLAAFGVESFDPVVMDQNNLTITPEKVYQAVEIINSYGKDRGENGMPNFLPGLNLIYGLEAETKKSNEENLFWLNKMLKNGLLLRRINIRQVNIFEGTQMANGVGLKFFKKNKGLYWKWRNAIRQNIDYPMIQKIIPKNTILNDVQMEIHDGKHTFGRQMGSYPMVIGINDKIPIKEFYDVKVVEHMLRSIVATIH